MKQGLKKLGVISLLKLIIFSEFSLLTRLSLAEPTPTVTPTQSQADEENLPPPEITPDIQPETPMNFRNETLWVASEEISAILNAEFNWTSPLSPQEAIAVPQSPKVAPAQRSANLQLSSWAKQNPIRVE